LVTVVCGTHLAVRVGHTLAAAVEMVGQQAILLLAAAVLAGMRVMVEMAGALVVMELLVPAVVVAAVAAVVTGILAAVAVA
jgi:hypothetical protein